MSYRKRAFFDRIGRFVGEFEVDERLPVWSIPDPPPLVLTINREGSALPAAAVPFTVKHYQRTRLAIPWSKAEFFIYVEQP